MDDQYSQFGRIATDLPSAGRTYAYDNTTKCYICGKPQARIGVWDVRYFIVYIRTRFGDLPIYAHKLCNDCANTLR